MNGTRLRGVRRALPGAGLTGALVFALVLALLPQQAAGVKAAGTGPGRVLFTHTLHARGHVRGTSVFNARTTALVRQHLQSQASKNIAVFGHIVSIGAHRLIVRQLPWNFRALQKSTKKFQDTSGPAGKQGVLVDVRLTARSMVQDVNGLAGLRPGMNVLIGGALSNHVVSAIFIADMDRGISARTAGFGVYHALSGQRIRVLPHLQNRPVVNAGLLNFEGGFGGPSFNYNTKVNIPLLNLLAVTVTMTKFNFVAALDGWTYNWPFNFTGTAPNPLTMTQPGQVNLNVQPQAGGTGTYSDTFSGGLGFNIGITVSIWTALGCGTLGLHSCTFDKDVNVGILSMVNKTQLTAPMAGQTLSVPAVACPGLGIGIPDTPINAAEVDICSSFTFTGANFGGHVAASSGATMSPVDLSFDGTNPQSVSLTPTTTTPNLTMSNFSWVPTLDYGLFARFKVLTIPVYDTPSVSVTKGAFPMIADAATRSAAGFNSISGEPAQPTSTDFPFSADKAHTAITYTGASSGDYNDAAPVSATLRDNLGTPVPNKTLTFKLNNSGSEVCTAVTSTTGVAQCTITPTEVPAAGAISVTFDGDSQFYSSSATPNFSILREESAVHWTTVSNTQDYHDAAPLTATLTEDAGGPALAGQVLTFAIGSQSCSPQPSTNAAGAAGCTIGSLNQIPTSYTGSATYAGNSYYRPSSDSHSYSITREDTALTIGGDSTGIYGGVVGLHGVLTENDGSAAGESMPGTPISGKTVTFNWGTQNCAPQPSTDSTGYAGCSIVLSQPAGSQTEADAFAQDPYYLASGNSRMVFISQQPATITLDGSDSSPVQVNSAGGTASPAIRATIANTLPAGNIANATVSYTLTPIGPGQTYNCTVTPTGQTAANGFNPTGYTITSSTGTACPSTLTQVFNAAHTSVDSTIVFPSVQTNVYILTLSVGGSYYTGGPVTGSTTIYDPSLGFTTGGGTVTNPNTGARSNFGFEAKYLKSGRTQGNVNYVEHRSSGDVVLKATSIGSITLVNTGSTPYIAYIQGKATYGGVDNYSFLLTAIDNGEPGINSDRFGLQVKDPSGAIVAALTFPAGGPSTGAPTITGGNIQVHHS